MISINLTHGTRDVGEDDRDRARDAALAVLFGRDIEEAYREFQRQSAEFDDYDLLTGDAALWAQAERAADRALTEGWHNPDGAGCSISA
jgi:hypothetical protein